MNSNWDSYWGAEKEESYWRKPAHSVMELIRVQKGEGKQDVLDLGCGVGRHALAFAKAGFEVTALDGSSNALREVRESAKREALRIRLVEGSYLEKHFPAQSFDVVVGYNVIYHGIRTDMEQAVRIVLDYLRPGGVFFFTCPTRDDAKYGSGTEVAPNAFQSTNSVHPGDVHYFANEDDLKAMTLGYPLEILTRDEHYWENNGEILFSSYWHVLVRRP